MKTLIILSYIIFGSNLWAATISVEGAYVRHLPPTQSVTAAFMILRNPTDIDRKLVSAESDITETVEFHTHLHENGMMRMRQVEKIQIPARGETVFQPGGFHLMLIGLRQPLKLGQAVTINLTFDDGATEQIQAEVKSTVEGMKMQGAEMDHSKMKNMAN